MKNDLHPTWFHNATVTCACGSTFTTGATQATLEVDICSKCHPFFTGEMRFVDRQGRVDKFRQKMELAQQKQAAKNQKKPAAAKTTAQQDPQSYRQILQQQKQAIKQTAKAA